ncbi:hypothetical protein GCM10010404_10170 [Nonomuraea africana]|uniref:DUF1579 domain-containing protein n=1 Tax=Nonomuraea africana TaxID=46171 RepID=A0ABR9K8G7_9ACTN|nr:DUF1579 family protein [Nonomuraea africana]MBE1558302.1 hypothetical protein [Nonomuraea africana]
MLRKISLTAASAVAVLGMVGAPEASAGAVVGTPAAVAQSVPSAARAADDLAPGPHHRVLDSLVGTWKATKTNYLLGTDGQPVVSRDMTVKVRWIAKTGGRFLEEKTEGTLGDITYFRLGVLGFSTIDRRYEWTTFDSVTPTAMTYRGAPVSGSPSVLSIPGEFTDPGVLGPDYRGKAIPMRTVITIRSKNKHTFDLYFTPPGQSERLVDRVVYTRKIK